jgi:hypothetical protein
MCIKFIGQPEGKIPIRRPMPMWYDSIEMCFKAEYVNRSHLAEDRASGN